MSEERFQCEASSYDEYHNPASYNVWDTVKRIVDYDNSLLEKSQACVDLQVYEDMCEKLNQIYNLDKEALLCYKAKNTLCNICEYESICEEFRECEFEIKIERGVQYVKEAKELLSEAYEKRCGILVIDDG